MLALPRIPKSKKVFDNSKVTDHHAIIPTGQSPAALVGNERQLYHLIARRFIAAFYPDCEFMQTTVLADAGGIGFKASGKVVTSPGWRSIYQKPGEQAAGQGATTMVTAVMTACCRRLPSGRATPMSRAC